MVRIRLLGGFSVSVGTRVIRQEEWRSKKAAALVKVLALAPGHRMHREQSMELLWPDSGKKAANNLRQVLYGARRVLDPGSSSRESYLSLKDEHIILCPEGQLWVDLEAFEEAAATTRRSRDPRAYRSAIELYAGELLPEDRYEEWAEGRRIELRQLYLVLLIELAGLYEESGEYERGIEALRNATSEDPTLEEAHASLMRLHALSGRPEHALAQYERLRDALQKGMGTQPTEVTRRLRDEMAAGRLPTAQPAGGIREEPADATKHNLPAPMTSFVGREREMVEIKRTLAMTRLLTLTGTGGSGKTRLAIEVARDLVGTYPDGVWLVELAPLSESGLVAQEVANVLGVQERPGEPLVDTLVEALAGKEMLLVLDNCEHLVEAAARLVDTLLASCPHLKVLATSREPLGVSGEVNWAVPPLSLPEATNGEPTVEAMMSYEAVRLFVERARLRLLDFEVSRENAGAVARVCLKLDGIPLAIELATARMGALAVEQVAQRLEISLDVLKGPSRTAAARQRTLRATLDWSHDLLSDDERTFFGRLSVFAGGWTLEAAEVVCSGDGIEEVDGLDLLGGLVDKSLVVAGASTDGAVRYGMLEPIRQYAREKLEEGGEGEQARSRHADYFLALAEEAGPLLWEQEQATWLRCLEADHDNVRAALSWALESGKTELGLQASGKLWRFWWMRGYYDEGKRWLSQVLDKDGQAPEARAQALMGMGWLALEQDDMELAKAAAEEGLELTTKTEIEKGVEAFFWGVLGDVAKHRGERKEATRLYEQSLSLCREVGDEQGIAWALLDLANVSSDQEEHARAARFLEEGLLLAKELGSAQPLGYYLISLGYESLLQGNHERATELNEQALAVLAEREHRSGLQYALDNLGWAALLRGDHDQAHTLHAESLKLAKEMGDRRVAAESLEGLACAAWAKGQSERGAKVFGAAEGLREAIGFRRASRESTIREPYLGAARSRLGKAAWEAAFAEGQSMTFEEAVGYALSEVDVSQAGAVYGSGASDDQLLVVLTSREREVATLVARGLTNRQIAQELSISERTTGNHVAKVLKKLGLASRVQIASWVTERRSLAADQE